MRKVCYGLSASLTPNASHKNSWNNKKNEVDLCWGLYWGGMWPPVSADVTVQEILGLEGPLSLP